MNLITEIENKKHFLNGSTISLAQEKELLEKIPSEFNADWLFKIMKKYPISGVCFSLSKKDDLSGLGLELKWFSASEIIDEMFQYYPGILICKSGYLPIGGCLKGSGDPYFLKIKSIENLKDPAIVRIPHDYVTNENTYPEDKIEIVCESLSVFFHNSKLY